MGKDAIFSTAEQRSGSRWPWSARDSIRRRAAAFSLVRRAVFEFFDDDGCDVSLRGFTVSVFLGRT